MLVESVLVLSAGCGCGSVSRDEGGFVGSSQVKFDEPAVDGGDFVYAVVPFVVDNECNAVSFEAYFGFELKSSLAVGGAGSVVSVLLGD